MMRKTLSWFLACILTFASLGVMIPAYALEPDDVIPNDETGIPDPVLYQAILDICDENGNNELTVAEAANNLDILDISYSGVSSLAGIQFCTNLTSLNASRNEITAVDMLSACTNLTQLQLPYNQITDATGIANLVSLETLDLSGNYLTDIPDLTGLVNLNDLRLLDNYLAEDILLNKTPTLFSENNDWINRNKLEISIPSEELMQDLLVGDILRAATDDANTSVTYEVVSGDPDVFVEYRDFNGNRFLKANKLGSAQIRITISVKQPQLLISSNVYQMKVGETSSALNSVVITPTLPEKVKMGDDVQGIPFYHVSNNPGAYYHILDSLSLSEHFTIIHVGSELWGEGDFDLYYSASTAINPGTATFQPCVYFDSIQRQIGDPLSVTVEEPEIISNLGAEITVGTSTTVTTNLTNTSLKNLNVTEVKDFYRAPYSKEDDDYQVETDNPLTGGVTDPSHQFNFEPKVEVLEGADLIEITDADFSHTLSTSQKINFKKTGTVTFKVTYQFIHNDWTSHQFTNGIACFGSAYSPEKIITIHVVEPSPEDPNQQGGVKPGEKDQHIGGENPATGDTLPVVTLIVLAAAGGFALILVKKRVNN